MREIGDIIWEFEARKNEPFALASLVRTHGASYRLAGARMLIDRFGKTTGSISAGCIEEEVVERAKSVLTTGQPAWMTFDMRRRFGCHGSIEVFIERAERGFLAELARHWRERTVSTVATVFAQGVSDTGTRMMDDETSYPADTLIQQIDPPLRLVLIGDGPENTTMQAFARAMGWEFAVIEGVPERLDLFDEWTAAIVKTHNYGRDFAALQALLRLAIPYVGLIGSRRRREQVLADLLDIGVEIPAHLHSPAGLDLQSDSPEAVALSIVAEIQAVISDGSGQPLSSRLGPIHRRQSKFDVMA